EDADIMKKILLTLFAVFTLAFVMLAIPASAHAAEVNNFKITSGINTEKTSEITFDSSRVVSGTAEPGAVITITIYEPTTVAGTTTYKYIRSYSITVGSSGIFSQSISLKEGKNYVVAAARKDSKYSEVRTTITRKNAVLKATLSQSIAVPGSSNW
ncbi:MAG: hypothetical protein Q4F63_00600, partial [Clostridia bacterium]|nr:hypothetical protein [Clostridia bacterium]